MDTTEVEKFFAHWKDNSQEQMETQMVNKYKKNVYFFDTIIC